MKLSIDDDPEFWGDAGPAVLRLKLLEVLALLQRCDIHDDIRATARSAACELRQLIAERPCISFVDIAAREKVLEEDGGPSFATLAELS